LILFLSALAQPSFAKEVKDLTAEDLLVSSDLSESEPSSEEDQLANKPEHIADQPTVEATSGVVSQP
jgi:hypothetical protein